ncbi:MAG: hypothetical protein AB7G37_01040 [Solirubrobacteraceae bacterium]
MGSSGDVADRIDHSERERAWALRVARDARRHRDRLQLAGVHRDRADRIVAALERMGGSSDLSRFAPTERG